MATKKDEQKNITMEKFEQTLLELTLVGQSDLILNKKARSYELPEIYKQSHPRGDKLPERFSQPYNLYEKLMTSITWEKPITFHDDDWSLYTEEEWRENLKNNRPCILSLAFMKSFMEAFVTFFKETTGKNGTDLKRSLSIMPQVIPVNFASATYEQKLVPTNTQNHTNVLTQYNVFHGWDCKLRLAFPNRVFPMETIISLVSTCGEYLGVGTQRSNQYGRYSIGEVKEIKLNPVKTK